MRERCGQAAPTLILAGLWLATVALLVWALKVTTGR
jgi:hypothetical protein